MNNTDFLNELKARHDVLVEEYARFKKCASLLMRRGSVRYDKERNQYFIRVGDYFRGTYRDRIAAEKLMQLQKLITEQSMLLLELENTIK